MKDNQNLPLISVILPVRNAAGFLEKCLESISDQSYPNFEIIAIDDFSSDSSFSILQRYKKHEKRLRIWRNVKRYGPAISLNRALKKAEGKFIAFMKAEDMNHKDRLKKQLTFLLENKKVVAVGSQCYFLNENGKRIDKSNYPTQQLQIYQKPLHGVSMQFEGMMINKYLIPKDILYFHTDAHPFIYSDILVKLLQYGHLENLSYYLYNHRRFGATNTTNITNVITSAKLWLRSEAKFGHRPSFKNFVLPLLRIKMSA